MAFNLISTGIANGITKLYLSDTKDEMFKVSPIDNSYVLILESGEIYKNIKSQNKWGFFTSLVGTYMSPDGSKWMLTIDNNGELSTIKIKENTILPDDFPNFTLQGEGVYDGEYLLTPITFKYNDTDVSYIFTMNKKGQVLRYKQINKFAQSLKKIIYPDGTIRYTYIGVEAEVDGGKKVGHLVILDENFEVVKDNIYLKGPNKSITDSYLKCDPHNYLVFNDNHYIITGRIAQSVTNIPGYEGIPVNVNNEIIQEIKNNEIVWQFETIDYPELYNICGPINNKQSWDKYLTAETTDSLEYAHINGLAIDPRDKEMVISIRYIGLIKYNKQMDKIQWIMGRFRNDLEGVTVDDIMFRQHDIKIYDDNSYIVFDNNKQAYNRICRYWIDSENKKVEKFQIFVTNEPSSNNYGSCILIDENTNTYAISYRGKNNVLNAEEYNFNENKQNFVFKFKQNYDMYSIFADKDYATRVIQW